MMTYPYCPPVWAIAPDDTPLITESSQEFPARVEELSNGTHCESKMPMESRHTWRDHQGRSKTWRAGLQNGGLGEVSKLEKEVEEDGRSSLLNTAGSRKFTILAVRQWGESVEVIWDKETRAPYSIDNWQRNTYCPGGLGHSDLLNGNGRGCASVIIHQLCTLIVAVIY